MATISISKPSAKRKKRLQYNFKEISTQLMLTKTSAAAGKVAAKARRKAVLLQKKRRTDEYDDKEVEQAIIHAKKLERIAKKRKKHLEEEEKAEGTGSCLVETEEYEDFDIEGTEEEKKREAYKEELEALIEAYQEFMDESMEELNDTMKEMEEDMGLEELADELLGGVQEELNPEDLERLKKKHRSDEMREIMEADLKYLKALFDKLAKEKQEASSGVSLQLGGMEMPVPPVEEPIITEGGSVDVSL